MRKLTGNVRMRAQRVTNRLVLQVEDEKGWRDATVEDLAEFRLYGILHVRSPHISLPSLQQSRPSIPSVNMEALEAAIIPRG